MHHTPSLPLMLAGGATSGSGPHLQALRSSRSSKVRPSSGCHRVCYGPALPQPWVEAQDQGAQATLELPQLSGKLSEVAAGEVERLEPRQGSQWRPGARCRPAPPQVAAAAEAQPPQAAPQGGQLRRDHWELGEIVEAQSEVGGAATGRHKQPRSLRPRRATQAQLYPPQPQRTPGEPARRRRQRRRLMAWLLLRLAPPGPRQPGCQPGASTRLLRWLCGGALRSVPADGDVPP